MSVNRNVTVPEGRSLTRRTVSPLVSGGAGPASHQRPAPPVEPLRNGGAAATDTGSQLARIRPNDGSAADRRLATVVPCGQHPTDRPKDPMPWEAPCTTP